VRNTPSCAAFHGSIVRDRVAGAPPVRHVAGWSVVTVDGALDIYAAPALRERLVGLLDAGHHRIVVDMDAVTFIDSTGLGVLVGTLKRIRQTKHGALRVVATHDPVVYLMRMTQLDSVFGRYDSVIDAVSE
jgi:anti-sigma B factor antagonist